MIRLFAVLALAMTLQSTLAWTQTRDQTWEQCLANEPDTNIKACTALISSQDASPEQLATAYTNRGNAYLTKAEYDKAIKDYSEVIRLQPNDAYAFNNRGTAYMGKGQYDHAIEDFTKAVRLRSDDAEALYNRGNAYSSKSDYSRAITDYDEALRLNGSNAHALFARGMAKQQEMDTAGARTDLDAAEKIDPNISGKVMASGKSIPAEASLGKLQPKSTSVLPPIRGTEIPSDCAAIPGGSSEFGGQAPSGRNTSTFLYVDESPEQLKKLLPVLRGLRIDATQNSGNAVADPTPSETSSILSHAGATVSSMLRKMPNLSAKEEVRQISDQAPDLALPDRGGTALSGGSPQSDQRKSSGSDDDKFTFIYRIMIRDDPFLGRILDESRTDEHNLPVVESSSSAPHSVGFGITWLIFSPSNLAESRFNYLGMERIGNRDAYVLAFAQIPNRSRLRTVLQANRNRCSSFLQGLAWIDQSTFRILRMQTDLMSPLTNIHLDQLRSTINYGEVKIPQHELSLWLPNNVEIAWRTTNQTGGERHKYSNYKLFEASSTIHYAPPPND